MVDEDRAIVVGISKYPGLDELQGPENDARDFHSWVTDPNGGRIIKAADARLILSSDFGPPPPPADVSLAKPTQAEFDLVLNRWMDEGDKKQSGGEGPRIGRRLYIYMAGHGALPRLTEEEQTALLMANATRQRTGYHVLGPYTANTLFWGGYFDEVLLFMDCCREPYTVPSPYMPYGPKFAPEAGRPDLRYYAYGAKFRRLSFEKRMPDKKWHGIFTTTLLSGLRGAAVKQNDPNGNITAGSLKGYLYNAMKDFLTDEERADPDIPTEPQVRYEDAFADTWIIGQATQQLFKVRVHLPDNAAGKKVEIIASREGKFEVRATADPAPALWELELGRAQYLAQVLEVGRQQWFEVTGGREVDVQL